MNKSSKPSKLPLYFKRYFPFVITLLAALMIVLGAIHITLENIILLAIQIYLITVFTIPLFKVPNLSKQNHLSLSLPLLYMTALWSLTAMFHVYIEHITLISALLFSVVLGVTTPFLQPLLILLSICLEVSLAINYPLSLFQIYFHAISHLVALSIIPRFIHIEWVKKAIYPRIFELDELPLSQRYFVPDLHPIVENSGAPNIQPPVLDLGSVAADLLAEDGIDSRALDQMAAYWNESEDNLDPLDMRAKNSSEHDLGLNTEQVKPFLPASQIADFNLISVRHTKKAMQFLQTSFTAQLNVLRQQLMLDTAAVIWRKGNSDKAGLKSVSSDRKEWICKSFPIKYGILEEAFERPLAFQDPIEATHLVPYYDRRVTLSGFMSVPIFLTDMNPAQEKKAQGILCLDRSIDQPWESGDLKLVQSVAQKLALDIQTSRLLKQLSYNARLVERLYLGLKALNETLDVIAVAEASIQSIRIHDLSHFIAFCIREDDSVRVLKIWSDQIHLELDGVLFTAGVDPISQCLYSGQERNNHDISSHPCEFLPLELPEVLDTLKTAMVFPLNNPSDPQDVQGCIMVASRSEQLNESAYLGPIRLIVEQISVKLSLSNAHERLRELALKDGLTGLKNHMTFQSTLEEMLSRSHRLQQPLTLILLDIDHFKSLNDQYGHPFGDEVLKKVADTLALEMREVDLVARYGGEEFAIALEASTLEGGLLSANRVRESIEDLLFNYDGVEVRVTISLGVACYPYDSENKELLIERADKALYLAKRNGRNRVESWQSLASDEKHTLLGWTSHSPAILPPQFVDMEYDHDSEEYEDYQQHITMNDVPAWSHEQSRHHTAYTDHHTHYKK